MRWWGLAALVGSIVFIAAALLTARPGRGPSPPQWSNQSRNGSTIALDDEHAPPTGPSTVIRGIMKSAAERRAKEERERVYSLERAYRGEGTDGDGGAAQDAGPAATVDDQRR
jgi:hypothetical protein